VIEIPASASPVRERRMRPDPSSVEVASAVIASVSAK
jgi:hypothetical protein